MKHNTSQDAPETPNANSTPEEIASHAYWVWSQEGKSPNRDMNRWMQAAMKVHQHPIQEKDVPHMRTVTAMKTTETGKVAGVPHAPTSPSPNPHSKGGITEEDEE